VLGYHPLPLNVSDELAEKLRPTLPNLVRHVTRYGLSNKHAGYRGREKTYANYKAFAKDPAAEVALAFLSEEAYVQFVERFAPSGSTEAAIADYRAQRGEG
jgi:hypothetical protein